jgi:phosphotransferase system HPr-like phosphotransfer protein
MVISEADSAQDVVASLLAVASAGTVTGLKTTVAMTGAEAKAAMEKAKGLTGKYRAPGG